MPASAGGKDGARLLMATGDEGEEGPGGLGSEDFVCEEHSGDDDVPLRRQRGAGPSCSGPKSLSRAEGGRQMAYLFGGALAMVALVMAAMAWSTPSFTSGKSSGSVSFMAATPALQPASASLYYPPAAAAAAAPPPPAAVAAMPAFAAAPAVEVAAPAVPAAIVTVPAATAVAVPPQGACAQAGEDCSTSQCCSQESMQCYRKTPFYAGCRATCDPTTAIAEDGSAWDCAPLGQRTPDDSTPRGSWPGTLCSHTRQCNMLGFQCFEKNQYFAACKRHCVAGATDEKDTSGDGQPWTCKVLGGFAAPAPLVPAAPGFPTVGVSLFCIAVATAGLPVNPGADPEDKLIAAAQQKGLGIFGCDDSGVFQGRAVTRSTEWKSVANTDIFLSVWDRVQADGRYKLHDWTVKVDPDAVFFPDRLRRHLSDLRAPADKPIYVKNSDAKTRTGIEFGFMGSLEVFSKDALDIFFEKKALCAEHLGHDGGEDFYMKTCMDAIGAEHMKDLTMLNDKYTWVQKYDFNDMSFCTKAAACSFHPVKSVANWMACQQKAMAPR